jgi:ubiquinone/menaquinone biosynthesis C-methylase UbiE
MEIGPNTRRTMQAYDTTSEMYVNQTKSLDMIHERNNFLKRMSPSGRIIDMGCGWGKDARIFSDLGYKVTGIDLSQELLNIARKTSPNSEFIQADFSELPYQDQTFEGLWASASLLHAETKGQVPKILNEWHRVLRTNGGVYIAVKKGTGEEDLKDKRYEGVIKHYCYFEENEIKKIVQDAGFKKIVTEIPKKEDPYYTHPWINIYANA